MCATYFGCIVVVGAQWPQWPHPSCVLWVCSIIQYLDGGMEGLSRVALLFLLTILECTGCSKKVDHQTLEKPPF